MSKGATAAVRLPAERVAAWRLARQRLDHGEPARGPEQVARELVGVQAQVLSASALAIALRLHDGRVGATIDALAERRLVRSWAMRGTLHLFAADDYPTIVAALRPSELWRRPAWLRWFGLSEGQMESFIEAVGEILADGRPRTRAELSDALARRFGPEIGERVRSGWGSYLKPAAERGYLCQAAGTGSRVAFTRPDRWLPSWTEEDPDAALVSLVRRFLRAYGPASPRDIRLWWGVDPARLRPALHELGDELVEVEVEGARGLALAADLPAIQASEPIGDTVRLLGPFDPFILRGGLRETIIPTAHLSRVSRTAGWISPVVLVGGRVAGVWTSGRAGDRLDVTVELFGRITAALRRSIEAATDKVGEAHGANVRVRYGPVFATPPAADVDH